MDKSKDDGATDTPSSSALGSFVELLRRALETVPAEASAISEDEWLSVDRTSIYRIGGREDVEENIALAAELVAEETGMKAGQEEEGAVGGSTTTEEKPDSVWPELEETSRPSSRRKLCSYCNYYSIVNQDGHGDAECPALKRFPCKTCGGAAHFQQWCPNQDVGVQGEFNLPEETPPAPLWSDVTRMSSPESPTPAICTFCANIPASSLRRYNPESHTIDQCPGLSGVVCKHCHKRGHTDRYCPDKPIRDMNDPLFHPETRKDNN